LTSGIGRGAAPRLLHDPRPGMIARPVLKRVDLAAVPEGEFLLHLSGYWL
jgi:hypothetical protein